MEITLLRGLQQISTFCMKLCITGLLTGDSDSQDYTNLAAWLEKNGKVGPAGKDGTVSFDKLTDEQRASLRVSPAKPDQSAPQAPGAAPARWDRKANRAIRARRVLVVGTVRRVPVERQESVGLRANPAKTER